MLIFTINLLIKNFSPIHKGNLNIYITALQWYKKIILSNF